MLIKAEVKDEKAEGGPGSDGMKDTWVQCDSCNKWRRIPVLVAEQLDDNAQWHCSDNPNKAFASCKVAQELTNEEIDEQENESDNVGVDASPRRPVACAFMRACVHMAPHAATALTWSAENESTWEMKV
eukprot:361251-Chlamydomonas_euryale.AAC.7